MGKEIPTLRMGTSCDKLMASWKKLKKSLNWLKSTSGTKLSTLYFWLLTALEIVLFGSLLPSSHTLRSTFISSLLQHMQQIHRLRHWQQLRPRRKGCPALPISDYEVQSLSLVRPDSLSYPSEPSSDGLRSCSSKCCSTINCWLSMPACNMDYLLMTYI